MNEQLVDQIARAVLYEGYLLYPYRPSVKNRQRWTFGGLYPEAYSQAQRGSDASSSQTECLVLGEDGTEFDVSVRFLRLTERTVGKIDPPLQEWTERLEPAFEPTPLLRIGDREFHAWQEAEECRIALTGMKLSELMETGRQHAFAFPARRWLEPLPLPTGEIGGVLLRQQQALSGMIAVKAQRASRVRGGSPGLHQLTVTVANTTPLGNAELSRDQALLRSLVSTHAVLSVRQGEFVSLLDPPEDCREAAAACRNVGVWPVLVSEEGSTDTMLSSPIILYDYPQIAPESPGDLFDGTEIDEILTLRILTLTDEEKRIAAALDDRAGALLARSEALAREQLAGLHGTVRHLRPVT